MMVFRRANNTRSSQKKTLRERKRLSRGGREGGRAVQARDGWREREHERGMLREKGGIFIEAAVFIAAQRRGASGGRGLGWGFRSASHERDGERKGMGGERQLRCQ